MPSSVICVSLRFRDRKCLHPLLRELNPWQFITWLPHRLRARKFVQPWLRYSRPRLEILNVPQPAMFSETKSWQCLDSAKRPLSAMYLQPSKLSETNFVHPLLRCWRPTSVIPEHFGRFRFNRFTQRSLRANNPSLVIFQHHDKLSERRLVAQTPFAKFRSPWSVIRLHKCRLRTANRGQCSPIRERPMSVMFKQDDKSKYSNVGQMRGI